MDNQALEFENTLDKFYLKDIDITGWTIQDEKCEIIFFKFPKRHLRSSETVKVWTSLYRDLLKADDLFTNNCEDWSKAEGLLICDSKRNVVSTMK